MKTNTLFLIAVFSIAISACQAATTQDADELAKKLSNPVAALISLPIQANYDKNIGTNDNGSVWRTNIQPVIPFSISEDWNLISRTILPVINQKNIPIDGVDKSGLGDTLQSFFFSPKQPTSNGFIWGIGPAFLLNTATDDTLGSGKWGIGPTGVVLKQDGQWTYGILANHIESFAGDSDRDYVSASFVQPFLSYITQTKTTIGLNTESSYDWKDNKWTVPVNLTLNQLLKVGEQILQVGGGVRYWAKSSDSGPEDWGLRLQLTFLFPK